MEHPGHRTQQITRHVDELECACSVLLAIAFAHAADTTNVSWAAFSGWVKVLAPVMNTLLKATVPPRVLVEDARRHDNEERPPRRARLPHARAGVPRSPSQ